MYNVTLMRVRVTTFIVEKQ